MSWSSRVVFPEPLAAVRASSFSAPPIGIREARALEKNAYERGYDEASALYSKQIMEQRSEVIQLRDSVFKRIEKEFTAWTDEVNRRLPGLAMAIASRILGRVEISGTIVQAVILDVMGNLSTGHEELEIRLNADDLSALMNLDEADRGQLSKLSFKEDPGLKSGDCLIQGRYGLVDARMETRLKHLQKGIGAS